MNWSLFFGELVSGLTLGSIYALIALGYTMVYGILKLLNFAHGDVYMVGAFVGFFVLKWLGGPLAPAVTGWLAVAIMFTVAMLACGALGVVIERFAYRPLRNAPRIAPLISALGVSFFLQNSALLLFGSQIRSYDTFELGNGVYAFPEHAIHWGPLQVSVVRLLTIGLAIVLCIGLTLFVARTRLGKAMRATAFDREAAEMMGIDVDRVIASAFFVGSALAGAAGAMFGLVFENIWNFLGFDPGLKAFTAAVIGGIRSSPRRK